MMPLAPFNVGALDPDDASILKDSKQMGATFVTEDARLQEYAARDLDAVSLAGLVAALPADSNDRTLAPSTEGLPTGARVMTLEQMRSFAQQAQQRHDEIQTCAARQMTDDAVLAIRELRVGRGYTWRAVARAMSILWQGRATWTPASNQIAGMVLCRMAAERSGENYMAPPWN